MNRTRKVLAAAGAAGKPTALAENEATGPPRAPPGGTGPEG